ncbi:MAG TPA: hypothetical protein VNI01_03410, partial [Elusimicrobiota bacterium]|nr:hypothetical protein [Elusimicrobiota bacterium]
MTLSRKVLRAGACALLCAWLPGIGRADDADQPRPRNSTSVGAAGGLFAPRLLPQDPPTTTAPPPTGGSLPTSITVPGGDRREFNYSPSASPAPTTPINAAPRQENREGRLPEGQSGAVTQPTPGTRPPTGNAPETGPKSSSPPVGEKSGDALHPIVSLISGIVSPLKGALPSAADPQKLQELYDKAKAGKPLAAEPPDSAKPDEKGVSADPKEKKNLTLDEMEDAAKKAAKADRDRIGSSEEPPPPSETPKKKKGPAPGEIFVARASDGSGYYYYLKGADSGRTFGRFVDGSKVLGWRL